MEVRERKREGRKKKKQATEGKGRKVGSKATRKGWMDGWRREVVAGEEEEEEVAELTADLL